MHKHVHERFETNQNIRHIGWVMLNCSNSQMASNGSVVHTRLVRCAWKTQWKTVINDPISFHLSCRELLSLAVTQSRSYDRDRTPPFSSPLPTILFASEPYQSKYQSALTPSQNSGELDGMRMNYIVCNHLYTINENFFH